MQAINLTLKKVKGQCEGHSMIPPDKTCQMVMHVIFECPTIETREDIEQAKNLTLY